MLMERSAPRGDQVQRGDVICWGRQDALPEGARRAELAGSLSHQRRLLASHLQSTLTLAKLEPPWLSFHFGSLPFHLGSLDLKSKTVKPQKDGVGYGSYLVTSSYN